MIETVNAPVATTAAQTNNVVIREVEEALFWSRDMRCSFITGANDDRKFDRNSDGVIGDDISGRYDCSNIVIAGPKAIDTLLSAFESRFGDARSNFLSLSCS